MILDLKDRDMLPCLMFHLNSFEAIRLLQALLAGLEYRQKCAFPTYYLDKIAEKSVLKKEADAQVKSTGVWCGVMRCDVMCCVMCCGVMCDVLCDKMLCSVV